MQTILLLIKDTAASLNPGNLIHCQLDLSQFNAVSHVLDLIISSAAEVQFSCFIVTAKITGTIDDRSVLRCAGVLPEPLPRLFFHIPIAKTDCGSPDADLPQHTGARDLLILFI